MRDAQNQSCLLENSCKNVINQSFYFVEFVFCHLLKTCKISINDKVRGQTNIKCGEGYIHDIKCKNAAKGGQRICAWQEDKAMELKVHSFKC